MSLVYKLIHKYKYKKFVFNYYYLVLNYLFKNIITDLHYKNYFKLFILNKNTKN